MDTEQLLLGKAAEEAIELSDEITACLSRFAKLALKAQQFGLNEVMPGQPFSNAERMHQELHDFNASIKMLNDQCEFGYKEDPNAISTKELKVEHFKEYSVKLGRVT